MKIKNASASQLLLAGLLALPLLPAQAVANATERDVAQLPALPPGGPADGHPEVERGRHGAMPAAPHGRGMDGPLEHGGFGPAHGQPPLGAAGFAPLPPMLHGIELSEAQQDKVFAILHAEVPYLREQEKAAARAGVALHAMGRAEQYDDAKAAALAKEAATAMTNIALQRVRTEQKLQAILTPEQRKKLAERALPPQHRP